MAFDGSVLVRLNNGFGTNSVSNWKKSSGNGGSGLSKPDGRRYGLRSGIGGVGLSVMSVSSDGEASFIAILYMCSPSSCAALAIVRSIQRTRRELATC